MFSRVLPSRERFLRFAVPQCSRHTVGMTDRSNAEVGSLVRRRMKACSMTEGRLRAAANVDRKTLLGLLDGTRWPQEDTRLKVELALGWQAGSIQDIREGKPPTLSATPLVSPLAVATDDELLDEIRRRMAANDSVVIDGQSTRSVVSANDAQELADWGRGFGPPSAGDGAAVSGDQ